VKCKRVAERKSAVHPSVHFLNCIKKPQKILFLKDKIAKYK